MVLSVPFGAPLCKEHSEPSAIHVLLCDTWESKSYGFGKTLRVNECETFHFESTVSCLRYYRHGYIVVAAKKNRINARHVFTCIVKNVKKKLFTIIPSVVFKV